jgi:zinc transport system substrate-binding protein
VQNLRSSIRRPSPLRPWLAAGAALWLALACGPDEGPAPTRARPLVVVSVVPQREFVELLAGGGVDVEVMVPPGASPALYEPTLGQLRALHEASLYVKVGHPAFPFERAHLDRLLGETPDLPVVDASRGIPLRPGDPHYWVAPEPARLMARSIADGLAARFPDRADAIARNLAALETEIEAAGREGMALLAPHRGERFFVFHPAWGYLADAAGLVQVAVEHDQKAPGAHRLAQLVTFAKEAGVRAIFVQPQYDRSAARVVASEIGADLVVLDPLAVPWSENWLRTARLLAEHCVP